MKTQRHFEERSRAVRRSRLNQSKILPSVSGRAVCLSIAMVVMAIAPALAQQTSIEAQLQFELDQAKQAIGAGEFDVATEILEHAVLDAAGTSVEPHLLFSLGIAHQKNAELAFDYGLADRTERSVAGSVRAYERLLEIRPDASAAYNNLGQLYGSIEEYDRAARYLAMAQESEANPDRRALYAMNLGSILSKTGDSEAAAGFFRQALDLQPENEVARDSMIAAYVRTDSRELGVYVWDLVEAGRNTDAARIAVEVLAGYEIPRLLSNQLLSAVALAMARTPYKRADFRATAAASELERILESTGPRFAEPIETLFLLHEGMGASFDPSSYDWWARRGREGRDPEMGVWPRDAFRELIRSMATWNSRRKNEDVAERYLMLSVRLWEDDPDLDAIVNLCDLYVRQNDWGQIEQLLDHYTAVLFEGKGQAYIESRWKEIFEYHRALGTMYGAVGRWGSENDVTSAIFQLERAEIAAREYNATPEVQSGQKKAVSFSPQMVNTLARAYDATSGPVKSATYRIDKTESYLTNGDTLKARAVFTPVVQTGLPEEASENLKSRYSVLSSTSRLSAVQLQPQIDASKLQQVEKPKVEEETKEEAKQPKQDPRIREMEPTKKVLQEAEKKKLMEAKEKGVR